MDIVEEIGMPAMLGQLAEECAELGKAALKLQRILMGKNPTPVTQEQAEADLLEESTDVTDCLCILGHAGFRLYDEEQSERKMNRWEERIRAAKGSREKTESEFKVGDKVRLKNGLATNMDYGGITLRDFMVFHGEAEIVQIIEGFFVLDTVVNRIMSNQYIYSAEMLEKAEEK